MSGKERTLIGESSTERCAPDDAVPCAQMRLTQIASHDSLAYSWKPDACVIWHVSVHLNVNWLQILMTNEQYRF